MQDEQEAIDENVGTEEVTIAPLKDWPNAPSVSDLKQDYTEGKTDFDAQLSKISKWLDLLKAPNLKVAKGKSSIQPKLVRKQAEWRYSALSEPFLSTEELFQISPVTFEDQKSAYQNSLIINNQFNTSINKVRFIGELVRTGVNEGTAIVRVGWNEEVEEVKVLKPEFTYRHPANEQEAELVAQIMQLGSEDPSQLRINPEIEATYEASKLNNGPIIATATGNQVEVTEEKIVANHPTVEVCDFNNVMVDPTCNGDISKANFVVFSFETSKAELESKGTYFNLDRVNWEDSNASSDPEYSRANNSNFTFKDKARKKVVAYEYWGYWDIDNSDTLTPIVATYIGDTMIQLEENPFPDQKLPFVAIQYSPVKGSIYGEPDAVLLEDNQRIVGAVTRGMIDIMGRSANGQVGMRTDALSVANKRKFEEGKDYEFNGAARPEELFYMHKFPDIPQSAEYMLSLQNAEAESLTGIKAFSTGISGQALGNTATGIRSALDATSKRELDILRRFSAGLEEVGRKILAMNSEWLSDEEIIRITNDEYLTIYRDDLAGKFDLKIAISTPESDEQKAQDLTFLLQTTAQSLGMEFTQMILSEVARLKRQPTLAKKIEAYKPTPDPIEQRKRELEVELLAMQIEYEKARAFKQGASGQLDISRVETEGSKRSNLDSDTDLKNLDFLNKDSGAEQAQELQRIEQNTEGQMKITELSNKLKSLGDSRTPTTFNGSEQV